MQTSPYPMQGQAVRCGTQTSPTNINYVGTQTSPCPMAPYVPQQPASFGPLVATRSPAMQGPRIIAPMQTPFSANNTCPPVTRPSCVWEGRQSMEDRVCGRCGCDVFTTRGDFMVIKMRKEAAKMALRNMRMGNPATSFPPQQQSTSAAGPVRGTPLPTPVPRTSGQAAYSAPATATVSPTIWRPFTVPAEDFETTQARAKQALASLHRLRMSQQGSSSTISVDNATTYRQ